MIDLKVASPTSFLVCFLSLKETTCETRKNRFISLQKLFSFLKFRIIDILSKRKNISLNNLGSKQSVNEIWPVYIILQKKKNYPKILQKPRPEN